jgi:hypothetical protein
LFEVLRKFFLEDSPFVFTSDEYNGSNAGFLEDSPRPKLPQAFVSLSHPEFANARSRVFLGVHWQFDADVGIAQGNRVATHVFEKTFKCVNEDSCDLRTGIAPRRMIKTVGAEKPAEQKEDANRTVGTLRANQSILRTYESIQAPF